MQIVAIQDANIIIDLIKIELFSSCLRLPYRFVTTNLILYSELNEEQVAITEAHIQSGQFVLIQISDEELAVILTEAKTDRKLSEQDWSAYYYAQKMKALLLTGDNHLRKKAEANGISVCGILWVLDELLATNIITITEAFNYLKDLMQKNKRLPKKECEARLREWGKE
jgi:predicted nucleic acid-binding protein